MDRRKVTHEDEAAAEQPRLVAAGKSDRNEIMKGSRVSPRRAE